MKKILLSLLMLCAALSAWSQTTGTVIITPPASNFPVSHDDETGIEVYGNKNNLDKTSWDITSSKAIVIKMPAGYVITAVKVSGRNDLIQCDNLIFNATDNIWVQNGTFTYYEQVAFTATNATGTTVGGVTITYHKHTFTHNEGKAATCTATGMTESWTCSDCGHTYYDNAGASEVAKAEDLVLLIDPTKHTSTLEKVEGVAATCVSKGKMEHWYCKDCKHCFSDETGQTQIAGDNVTTDIDPNNHADKLTEVAFKNASVVEDGIYHHWHCEACSNDYADADGTEDMNGKTAKAKYDADALLVGNNTVDESYLFDGAKVTFDGDMVVLAMGSDNHQYDLSETDRLLIGFSHTFKLTANQDPAKTSDYYSTFFTSEGAYKVPATAKAYIGEVKKGEDIDVLNLTATTDGLIPASEAVILRGEESDIVLMPSCRKDAASDDNMLQGSDEPMTLPDNSYALSLGQHGVGFYDFSGSVLPANKAYLTLDASAAQSVGLRFSFGDATEIDAPVAETANAPAYNLQGQQVDETYRGIVIVNGKKVLKR